MNANTINKPKVVSKLQTGDIIRLAAGDIQIVHLPENYQHNTMAAYKVATVLDAKTGEERQFKLYANFKYYVMNRD